MSRNPTLIAIGLWYSDMEPEFPRPSRLVDENWDNAEKEKVIARLEEGYPLPYPYAGKSWCRFNCGETEMGNRDFSDGYFLWPEGLPHYLKNHNVRLPEVVVNKLLTTPVVKYNFESDFTVDLEWWKGVV